MNSSLITEMVDAGVHYGHQTRKWHPSMKKYLLKSKSGIHIINLEETEKCLLAASEFLADLARRGKKILFVGCKRQAQEPVREVAEATGQYFVNNRWLGGTLTNITTIRKSVERLRYLESIEKAPEYKSMSKKELAALKREELKLKSNLDGIRDMDKSPDAMVVIGADFEDIAIREAKRLHIPVVALVDSNANPNDVDFPIPGNDDAVRSIRLVLNNLQAAIVAAKA